MNRDDMLVKQFTQDTGCDEELASLLLKFTSGDLEGAKRILKSVPKDIYILKAKFITAASGYYGALFICYDEKESIIKRYIAIVANDKEIGKIDIVKDWREFEEELYYFLRNRVIDADKVEQLDKLFNSKEVVKKIANIFRAGKTLKNDEIHNLINGVLFNVFTDTNIAVKFDVELTDAFELNKGRVSGVEEAEEVTEIEDVGMREAQREKNRAGLGKDQSLIVLKVEPVLSPVKGIEIKSLEFGDEVQVRITDERDIAEYLTGLLGGKSQGVRVPVSTKIVEVQELDDEYVGVLTQFGPGIMGMFRVLSDVRVVTEGEIEEPETQSPYKIREINPVIVIGGIVLGIILFILLMVLSK